MRAIASRSAFPFPRGARKKEQSGGRQRPDCTRARKKGRSAPCPAPQATPLLSSRCAVSSLLGCADSLPPLAGDGTIYSRWPERKGGPVGSLGLLASSAPRIRSTTASAPCPPEAHLPANARPTGHISCQTDRNLWCRYANKVCLPISLWFWPVFQNQLLTQPNN